MKQTATVLFEVFRQTHDSVNEATRTDSQRNPIKNLTWDIANTGTYATVGATKYAIWYALMDYVQ